MKMNEHSYAQQELGVVKPKENPEPVHFVEGGKKSITNIFFETGLFYFHCRHFYPLYG